MLVLQQTLLSFILYTIEVFIFLLNIRNYFSTSATALRSNVGATFGVIAATNSLCLCGGDNTRGFIFGSMDYRNDDFTGTCTGTTGTCTGTTDFDLKIGLICVGSCNFLSLFSNFLSWSEKIDELLEAT